MPKIALTGASGKLGGATLRALIDYELIAPSDLVISTSSDPNDKIWASVKKKGVVVKQATYDDPSTLERAFAGCERLLLVSTPHIQMDYNNAPPGEGREKHHFTAIEAAQKAGIRHIYYTSLLFQDSSKAAVMQAHNRTEDRLRSLKGVSFTSIREGLYNESWPLYLGFFDVPNDDRKEIVVAGDGPLGWTALSDLGLGTALILVDEPRKYNGKVVRLANTTNHTLNELAKLVSESKGEQISLKVTGRDECERYYINERHMDAAHVKWWASTYDALRDHETQNQETLLAELLNQKGVKAKPLAETVSEMLSGK